MKSSLLFSFIVAPIILVGCASTRSSIERGDARLIDGTVTVNFAEIKAIVAISDRRTTVSAYLSECKQGVGNLRIADQGMSTIPNVYANGSTPPDKIFARLCRDGLPEALANEEAYNRRRAAMTPQEREAEQRTLMQILTMQRAQQAEADRERAAQAAADRAKQNSKVETDCRIDDPTMIRCVTK